MNLTVIVSWSEQSAQAANIVAGAVWKPELPVKICGKHTACAWPSYTPLQLDYSQISIDTLVLYIGMSPLLRYVACILRALKAGIQLDSFLK